MALLVIHIIRVGIFNILSIQVAVPQYTKKDRVKFRLKVVMGIKGKKYVLPFSSRKVEKYKYKYFYSDLI